jgi:superfamily II RNA helicase
VNCQKGSSISKNQVTMTPTPGGIQPCEPGHKGEPQVVPILLTAIEAFSHLRIFLPKDIRHQAARDTVWKSVLEVQRRFPDGIGLLDPVQNMSIKDEKFLELIKVSFATLVICEVEADRSLENRHDGKEDVFKPFAQGPEIAEPLHSVFKEAGSPDADK